MRRRAVLLGLAAAGAGWAHGRGLYFPRPWKGDGISAYALDLVRLALGRRAGQFDLEPLEQPDMVQTRVLENLGAGRGEVQFLWSMTNQEREIVCEPIRIPMDRGLLGWRVPLIRAEDVERWQRMQQPAEAKLVVAGQGEDWPDATILRANGFKVETSTRYATLFGMLAHGRFDQFPRSVLEIGREAEAHAAERLVIAPRLLLIYPTATYFFVDRREAEFKRLLHEGLEKAVKNGEMVRLFRRHFDPTLGGLGLGQRLVLRLHNPLLPPRTPTQRPELWEQP